MGADQKNNPEFDGTIVDLGEDLLDRTREIAPDLQPIDKSKKAESPPTIEEELQRGEILMNERLFEDAKKVFRRILRQDSTNARARDALDAIQKQEVQDLLGTDAPRKRRLAGDDPQDDSPAQALKRLELELGISLDKPAISLVPDLFKDEAMLDGYSQGVLKSVIGLPPRDRIDIGVAYLEMGLYEVACAIFESVVRYEDHKLAGMYLLGLSLIHADRAIEATLRLEPLVRDTSLSDVEKTDFLYLMGMAFEALSDTQRSREFYRRVFKLNPKYRDVVDKLK